MHDETGNAGTPEAAPRPNTPDVPPPDAPNVAMRQALTGVLACCRQLSSAIGDRDSDALEQISAQAVNLWFSARAACRRLVTESEHPSPLTQVAIEAIENTYHQLVALFRRAIEELRSPRTSRALANLRAQMDVARADPLYARGSNTPARREQRDTQKIKPQK